MNLDIISQIQKHSLQELTDMPTEEFKGMIAGIDQIIRETMLIKSWLKGISALRQPESNSKQKG